MFLFAAVSKCQATIKVTNYEPVLVAPDKWTVMGTKKASNAMECGLKCQKETKCWEFRFEEGVCELSDLWIPGTTSQPSIQVNRVISSKLKF